MNDEEEIYLIGDEDDRDEIQNELRERGYHWVVEPSYSHYHLKCECGYSAIIEADEPRFCPDFFGQCGGHSKAVKAKNIRASPYRLRACKCDECPKINDILKLLPQPIYEEIFECIYRVLQN
jgi:hypothetical protein